MTPWMPQPFTSKELSSCFIKSGGKGGGDPIVISTVWKPAAVMCGGLLRQCQDMFCTCSGSTVKACSYWTGLHACLSPKICSTIKKTHNMEILDYWRTEVLHWGKEKFITNDILTTNAAFYLPFFLVIGKQVLFKLKQQWELWLEKKCLFLELFFLIEIGQLNLMSLHCKVFIVPLKVP